LWAWATIRAANLSLGLERYLSIKACIRGFRLLCNSARLHCRPKQYRV
jgi:hypothetical protein